MNMTHDPFEEDLRALKRRDLPAGWRDEMLHVVKPAPRTPRWLVAGWGLAWAAIMAMYFTTPAEPEPHTSTMHAAPALPWAERDALIRDLLAVN